MPRSQLGTYHKRIMAMANNLEDSGLLTPVLEVELHACLLEVDDMYTDVKTDVLIRMGQLTATERHGSSRGSNLFH